MDDYLKCKKCPDSDHEGMFCRCEDRNIRIAKERRERKYLLKPVENSFGSKFSKDIAFTINPQVDK